MKSIFLIFAVIVGSLLFLSLWGFYFAIRPLKITSNITPKNYGISYQNISFHTKDNLLIRGWFIPTQNPKAKTIILLHGYPADKGNIFPAMYFLHKKFNLLLFDFRYFGESEGFYSTAGKNEVLDLLAAIQYLNNRGIHEVGVWGFSLGGAVALMAAEQSPAIKAIVLESPYARLDWMAEEYFRIAVIRYPLVQLVRLWTWLFLQFDIKNISPANAAKKLNIPILLIHSEQDNVVSFRHGLLLQQALQPNPRAQFIFTKANLHGQLIENYQTIVDEFFSKNL